MLRIGCFEQEVVAEISKMYQETCPQISLYDIVLMFDVKVHYVVCSKYILDWIGLKDEELVKVYKEYKNYKLKSPKCSEAIKGKGY